MSRELAVPQLSLVVLIGVTGSGKSTFARTHIAGKRLAAGRLTVVDATSVQPEARAALVALAREHDVLPVAVVLDLPEAVCAARNAQRADRAFGPHVIRRQHQQLRRSLRGLQREGFRTVHVLRSQEEVAEAVITRTPLYSDLRRDTGPFDVIGDVHGCRAELETLLDKLGYQVERDGGQAVSAAHPGGRRVIFLGDLVDRGPDSPGVLRLAMGMVASGAALAVPGNHEDKLLRALRGRKVQVSHGLEVTLAQLAQEPPEFRAAVETFLDGLVSHYVLDGGRLVVAHAGLPARLQGRASGRVRSFCLYGQTTGETDAYGLPVRYPWAEDYRGRAVVLYGHTPVPSPEWVNNTLCLDTGCVFGGALTALSYPERELVAVPAAAVYYEPARPFPGVSPASPASAEAGTPVAAARREPSVLDLTDVTGTRVIETGYLPRVKVVAASAAAALEVMSRFALDPRWLLYLPPTMSPVTTAAGGELLEHPAQAFAAYAEAGVRDVVCEEKHMGSRAVVLVARSEADAVASFGVDPGIWSGCAAARWPVSGRWRCGSTPSAWRDWTG
jgi:protein phosphatase